MKAYVGYKAEEPMKVLPSGQQEQSPDEKEKMAQFMAMVPKRAFPKPVSTNGNERRPEPLPES
jgi:hypothetical protein